jgi:hypothetical protein
VKESTLELSILEAINCEAVDKYMETYKQKATKDIVSETVDYFWSSNKSLEDNSKPNFSDDDSSDDNEYDIEIDEELDGNSDNEYMLV